MKGPISRHVSVQAWSVLMQHQNFTSRGRRCHILTFSGVLIEAERKPIEHKTQHTAKFY